MPANRFRSRSYKRTNTKTPGGVNVLRYKKNAECGAVLHGVPRGRPFEVNKLAKTQKRPNRPFGGYLCPKCARKHFKDEARK